MAGAAATASTVAAAGAACCVLPLVLPAAALASFGGVLTWLAGTQSLLTAAAALTVAAGWLWLAWLGYRSRARPRTGTLFVMLGATTLLVLALLWRGLEPSILALLQR